MEKIKKILRIFFSLFLIIIFFMVILFLTIRQVGKNNLKENIVTYSTDSEMNISYQTITYQGKNYQYNENIINILCLGIDKEEIMSVRNDADNSIGQADAIFLVSMDLDNKELRVIAIPRDTIVTLQIYNNIGEYLGNHSGPLTLQYAYANGQEKSALLTTNQVSGILNNIPIHGYVAINICSLWSLNAAVDGVYITMDEDYTMFNPAFEKGATVHLTENLLENYIRGRNKEELGSSTTRIHRLKQYMLAFFYSAKETLKTDILLPVRALYTLREDIDLDLNVDEVIFIVSEAINYHFSDHNIYTLDGEVVMGKLYEEYHLNQNAVDTLIVDLFYEPK